MQSLIKIAGNVCFTNTDEQRAVPLAMLITELICREKRNIAEHLLTVINSKKNCTGYFSFLFFS
uniref:Uncharacterized protein n=1 Tax=Anguilla anguilla TaxID=7936 RepID=A0A0E9Q469_ANGAN